MAALARYLEWLFVLLPLYALAIYAAYTIRLYAITVYGRVIQ